MVLPALSYIRIYNQHPSSLLPPIIQMGWKGRASSVPVPKSKCGSPSSTKSAMQTSTHSRPCLPQGKMYVFRVPLCCRARARQLYSRIRWMEKKRELMNSEITQASDLRVFGVTGCEMGCVCVHFWWWGERKRSVKVETAGYCFVRGWQLSEA